MTDLYGNIPISGEPEPPQTRSHRGKQRDSPSKGGTTGGRGGKTPAEKQPGAQASTPWKTLILLPALFALLLALYYGASSYLVPYYLQHKYPSVFHQQTGLQLSLGSAQFNPLLTELVVSDVSISDPEQSSETLFHLGKLYIDLDLIALLRRNIVAQSLRMNKARLTIRRFSNKSYNFSHFFSTTTTGSSAIFNFGELPFFYSLNNIQIEESNITFHDGLAGKTHHIKNLHLSLPTLSNFAYDTDITVQPGFSAIINDSPIELVDSGDLDPGENANQTELSLALRDINLPAYVDYIPFRLPATVNKGTADLQLEMSFRAQQEKGFHLNLDYQAHIQDLLLTTNDDGLTLQAPSLRLEGSAVPLESDVRISNLLIRDPIWSIGKSFSSNTLNSFFPNASSSENAQSNSQLFRSPSITAELVIADNGKLIIESNDDSATFYPVQISMRNYANATALRRHGSPGKSSFRITGESQDDFSTFSWQGSFSEAVPSGPAKVNNIPLKRIVSFLGNTTDTSFNGTADIRGEFSLHRSPKHPLDYSFENGALEISSLTIKENGEVWLKSPSTRLSPLSSSSNGTNLGNLFIENGTLRLAHNAPPSFLKEILNQSPKRLQGVDFKGDIHLQHNKSEKNALHFQEAHLQANNLEKEKIKDSNLAFSATTGQAGSFTGKGIITTAPLKGEIDIAFSKTSAVSMLPFTGITRFQPSPQTLMSGRGRYNIDSAVFEGAFEFKEAHFTDSSSKHSFSFDRAVVPEVVIDSQAGKYQGSKIILQNLAISGEELKLQTQGATCSKVVSSRGNLNIGTLSFARADLRLYTDFASKLAKAFKKAKMKINLETLNLYGTAKITGKEDDKETTVNDFNLQLGPFDSDTPQKDNISLTLDFNDRAGIESKGTLNLDPFQADLHFDLRAVDSETIHPFLPSLGTLSYTATINGKVTYAYPDNSFSGNLNLDDGVLYSQSNNNTPLASWHTAGLNDFSLSSSPFRLSAARLNLEQPKTSFSRESDHFLADLREATLSGLAADGESKGKDQQPQLHIDDVLLHSGELEYVDQRMSPPWRTRLSDIQATFQRFHLQPTSQPIQYDLQGAFSHGRFSMQGVFSLRDQTANKLHSLQLNGFPLELLEQQLTPRFDVNLAEGRLDLALSQSPGDELSGASLTLHKVHPTDNDSTTAFAIALLTDGDQTLSTELPLDQSGDPLFRRIISHFQKILVKCSVSPYLLLPTPYNQLYDKNTISFAPSQTALTPEAQTRLNQYGELLQERPQLMLEMTAVVQSKADARALKKQLQQKEEARVREENKNRLQKWQEQQYSAAAPPPSDEIVEEKIQEQDLAPFTPISPEPIIITEAMLNNLGRQRAEQARQYILEKYGVSDSAIEEGVQIRKVDTLDMPEIEITLHHRDNT